MPSFPSISSGSTGNSANPYNFPLIGIGAMFGLFLCIIVYYIVINKHPNQMGSGTNSGRWYNNNNRNNNRNRNNSNTTWGANGKLINNSNNKNSLEQNNSSGSSGNMNMDSVTVPTGANYSAVSKPTVPQTPQVFNIKENQYTFEEAHAVCGALGTEVATIEQLVEAHKNGADWCNVGWTKDGLAAYPTQLSTWQMMQDNVPAKRNSCGVAGINMVRNDPNLLYGVNCYGVKPVPKGNEKVQSALVSDKQAAINAQIAKYKQTLNDIGIAPFNHSKWSQ
jgi:hypothetical protein